MEQRKEIENPFWVDRILSLIKKKEKQKASRSRQNERGNKD
jgi:hypothetical protein